jgi:hypothetical protein
MTTTTTTEIRCPKCDSNQLTANKKGFSGGKALVGGVLTGGVGLLAGTIGSKNIIITCLACGKQFKPGEGKAITKPILSDNNLINESSQTEKYDETDYQIIHLIKAKGKLAATKYCKETKNLGLKVAKEYVDKIAFENGLGPKPLQSEGCFIATACYGDYDAPEVIVLRKYRDEVLYQTEAGKIFVKIYYSVSPTFAKVIRQSVYFRNITRRILLKPLISRIEKNTNR